jgi:uncharacterized protein
MLDGLRHGLVSKDYTRGACRILKCFSACLTRGSRGVHVFPEGLTCCGDATSSGPLDLRDQAVGVDVRFLESPGPSGAQRGRRYWLLRHVHHAWPGLGVCCGLVRQFLIFGAAMVAGAMNSVAGGGTLVSFPTLVWLGVPAVSANMTNAVALWPGSLGSVWGYRRELRDADPRVFALVAPSLAGGIGGAMLLAITPTDVFERLVPLLILFATGLFMAQEPIQRRFNLTAVHDARSHWLSWTMLFQLFVGLYGGYFGAGIGILMLAALSLMGHTDIHQMNGVKNLLAVCVNGIAAIYFAFNGLVMWPDALVMGAGAILGGVGGADVARRLGRRMVRRIVIVIGFGMAASMALRL